VDSDIVCIKLQGEGVPFSGWTLYKVTIPRFSFFMLVFVIVSFDLLINVWFCCVTFRLFNTVLSC